MHSTVVPVTASSLSTAPLAGQDVAGVSGGSFVSNHTEDGQDTIEAQTIDRGSLGVVSHVTCSTRNEVALVVTTSVAHGADSTKASKPIAAVESFTSPDAWSAEFRRLRGDTIESIDYVALVQNGATPLNRLSASRVACCVRAMPELERLKAALRRRARAQRRQPYDMWDDTGVLLPQRGSGALAPRPTRSAASRAGTVVTTTATHGLTADYTQIFLPPPAIWTVSGAADGAIHVYNATSGRRVMSVYEPKLNVPVTTLLHAPFRGLMTRKLHVLPISQPQDLLRLNTRHLIYTDYVWVGFADGAVRLFPANPSYVQDSDRGAQTIKGELADMVFELPKYHTAGVIAFARSPCHQDTAGAEVSTANRLTTAVQYMTAATRHTTTTRPVSGGLDGDNNDDDDDAAAEVGDREHLSLLCTASVDSSVVVWDVKKIYRAIEGLRAARREAAGGGTLPVTSSSSVGSAGAAYAKEVVTIEGYDVRGKTEFSFRSSCQLVNVRPLMRLKGSVAALKTLHWVSTLVSSREYRPGRDVAAMTRAPEEAHAPDAVKERQAVQRLTVAERREQHRQQLHISVEDMREIEEELEQLMPHLRREPAQSLRINLLVASDNIGGVHLWNLDEELRKSTLTPAQAHTAARTGRSSATPSRSPQRPDAHSAGRARSGAATGSLVSGRPHQLTSPSVQLSAVDAVRGSRSSVAAAAAARTKRLARNNNNNNHGLASHLSDEPTRSNEPVSKRMPAHATRPASSPSPGRGSVGISQRMTAAARVSVGTAPSAAATTRHSAVLRGSAAHPTSPSPATRADERQRGEPACSSAAPTVPPLSRMQMLVLERQQPRLTTQQGAAPAGVSVSATVHDSGRLPASPSPQMSRAYSPGGGSPSMTRSTRRSPAALSRPRTEASTAGHGKPRKAATKGKALRAVSTAVGTKATATTRAAGPTTMTTSSAGGTQRRDNRRTPGRSAEAAAPPSRTAPATHRTRPVLAAQSERQRVNDFLSRSANCRIEFTGGVAVTGMAIDLPPVLHCTLRRVAGRVARNVSLLDEPTAAEIEERVLQNSFDPLSEPRALYLVFQRLQLYVSVEGAVLNLRCVPHWQCADDDGRELFMHTQEAMYETRKEYQLGAGEVVIAGRVQMPGFDVELRKRLVEVHSQPVTQLLLQPRVRQLWVARNDGILTIFDTETRRVLTRVPHPCASTALGPPNELEWRRQQRALVQESALLLGANAMSEGAAVAAGRTSGPGTEITTTIASSSGVRLEWHKETEGYPASHFTFFVPFRTRMQIMLALRSNRAIRGGSGAISDTEGRLVVAGVAGEGRWPSQPATVTLVQRVDGRSDMSVHAQCLERHLSQLLGKLFVCRTKADAVRSAQRASYEALCTRIADNVAVVVRQFDTCTSLPYLRRCYEMWRRHARRNPRAHVLRQLYHNRLQELHAVASHLASAAAQRLRMLYFAHWVRCRTARNTAHQRHCVARLLRDVVTPPPAVPSADMMTALWRRRTRMGCFAAWRAFAARRVSARRRDEGASYALSAAADVNRMGSSGMTKTVTKWQPCLSSNATNGATASCRTTGSGLLASYGEYSGSSNGGGTLAASDQHSGIDVLRRRASNDTSATQPSEEGDKGAVAATGNGTPTCLPAFLAAVVDVYKARAHILRASDTAPSAKNIIDDSWLSIIESAEANAGPSASREQLKLCVFQYGFLPLLQGMLVTADDVLPNLYDTSVVTEVRSMFGGIMLCMDYIMADAEVVLARVLTAPPVLTEIPPPALDKTQPPVRPAPATVAALPVQRGSVDVDFGVHGVTPPTLQSDDQDSAASSLPPLLMPELLCRRVMAHLATIAAADEDCLQAMEDIACDVESLEAFMAIVAAPRMTG